METEPIKVMLVERPKPWLAKLSDYSAITISVLALTLSIYEGYESRAHDRLSVKPAPNIQRSSSALDNPLGVAIQNNGLGPARLRHYRAFYRKKLIVDDNLHDANTIVDQNPDVFRVKSASIGWVKNNTMILPNASFWVFRTDPAHVSSIWRFEHEVSEQITVTFQICSLYEECEDICDGPMCSTLPPPA